MAGISSCKISKDEKILTETCRKENKVQRKSWRTFLLCSGLWM